MVEQKLKAMQTSDGAGVKIRRAFGYAERQLFDPFLMLDFFGSDNPDDYLAGFPWHPHRGIETVTYLLEGEVDHGDSMGNTGRIGPGDAQWMTSGSGIIHQEMPKPGRKGPGMHGFQLWVNLPASLKMVEPRYRSVAAAEIPRISKPGAEIGVLAGSFEGHEGATPDLFVPVLYLIIRLEPDARLPISVPADYNAAVFVHEGKAGIGGTTLTEGTVCRLPPQEEAFPGLPDRIELTGGSPEGAGLLLMAGKPLG
ncbi:MAG: pirin family protein, partial [Spirochaetaceae bacterium]|nr:pirin family protein [Spirochaetaceae bacterium]